MKKRLTALLLCVALIVGVLVPGALAANSEPARDVVRVGDYLQFGRYDHLTGAGRESFATPIDWVVLEINDGIAKMISRYVLDERKLDTFGSGPNAQYITNAYLGSPLESWLNSEFKATAFTEDEQAQMLDYSGPYYSVLKDQGSETVDWQLAEEGIKVGLIDRQYLMPGDWWVFVPWTYTTYKNGTGNGQYVMGTAAPGAGGVNNGQLIVLATGGGYTAWGANVPTGVRPVIRVEKSAVSPDGSNEVVFGSYRHITSASGAYEGSPTPIEWLVIDEDEDSYTLFAKYIVDGNRAVDATLAAELSLPLIDSELEGWLNGAFKNAAFNDDEATILVDYRGPYDSVDRMEGSSSFASGKTAAAATKVGLANYSDLIDSGDLDTPVFKSFADAELKNGAAKDYWTGTTTGRRTANVIQTGDSFDMSISDINRGVRPVIQIDLSRLIVSGSGSSNDPFTVDNIGNDPNEKKAGEELTVGDYINIGKFAHILPDGVSYEQDATDVLWLVLNVDGNRAQLISKYVLDKRQIDSRQHMPGLYSELSEWLNNEFLENAFSAAEKDLLLLEYSRTFNASDDVNGNQNANAVPWLGTKVSFADIWKDIYNGTGPIGGTDWSRGMAGYKGGSANAEWLTGTSYRYAPDSLINYIMAVTPTYIYPYDSTILTGVRPTIEVDLSAFTMTGLGTEKIPYTPKILMDGIDIVEGDYINIGQYAHRRSNGTYEEPTDILWWVFSVDEGDGSALLVSKYVLDQKAGDTVSGTNVLYSPLAEWLTTDFIEGAFSETEQELLLPYDRSVFYISGVTSGARPNPGTRVGFADYWADIASRAASRPLGSGGQSDWTNVTATYRDKITRNVAWWLGTYDPGAEMNSVITSGVSYRASNEQAGIRPMMKIDLTQFTVTGMGIENAPYDLTPYPPSHGFMKRTVWENPAPLAELDGKVLTLSFAGDIEVGQPGNFRKTYFVVSHADSSDYVTSVITADIVDGKFIIGLADYLSPGDGDLILKYSAPDNSFIFKEGTAEYVTSFTDVPVTNNNENVPPPANHPGFSVQDIKSLKQGTVSASEPEGILLHTVWPAWGGHQPRIVRTDDGVYLAVMAKEINGDLREFRVYKIDGSTPILIGKETTTGVAISFVAGLDGSLYVLGLDMPSPNTNGVVGYGVATAWKYAAGADSYTASEKIQYNGPDLKNNINYEGVTVTEDGNIVMVISYVDNSAAYNSKLLWLTLDAEAKIWGQVHSAPVEYSELYMYVLPKAGDQISVFSNVGGPFSLLGYEAPPGFTYLWHNMTLWDVPDANGNTLTEIKRYEATHSPENVSPMVQASSFGDAYVDSFGYTHLLFNENNLLGIGSHPDQMRYAIYNPDNILVAESIIFDGAHSARFAEAPDGMLYILKMTSETNKLEVYAVNDARLASASIEKVFTQRITDANGAPCISTYSGLSVTSPRAGSLNEFYVDVAVPVIIAGSGATVANDWVTFRLNLPGGSEEVTLIDVNAEAKVTKLAGSQNELTITVTEIYSDGTEIVITKTLKIDNNAAGIYDVGEYKVYVDTKGNTQIRACYIVE